LKRPWSPAKLERWSPAKLERLSSKESWGNQPLDELGLIYRKLKGTKALPFMHILQYKEEELVQQSVVCRCSEEGLFLIICRKYAIGALVFPVVE
jgi:hypothetical protein